MLRRRCGPLILLCALGLTSGGAVPSRVKTGAVYSAQGVVQLVDASRHRVTIAHDTIPGYMDAMVMNFSVHEDASLTDLRAGDAVAFQLHVTGDDAWIDDVRKNGRRSLLVPAPVTARTLIPGDRLPEIELVNQRGEKILLSDFQGHVLALTFIYTRCPLPTYCPLMNRNFQAAQTLLDRLDVAKDSQFLSISMDAGHDTPEVLADYAQAYQADGRRWTFAVADEPALHLLGAGIGLEFNRRNGQLNHNLRTVVLDARGRIQHIFAGNDWTPQELAAVMRAADKSRASIEK